jgi:aminoglycoside phosphotransferase (APT) family kinase protein
VSGEPRAIIDFDTAGPGSRIWDVAYAVYRFVPLTSDEHSRTLGQPRPAERGRRLRLFCDAYGLEQRHELLENVERRLEVLCAFMTSSAASGDVSYKKAIEAGHLDLYLGDIQSLRRRRAELEQSLL